MGRRYTVYLNEETNKKFKKIKEAMEAVHDSTVFKHAIEMLYEKYRIEGKV